MHINYAKHSSISHLIARVERGIKRLPAKHCKEHKMVLTFEKFCPRPCFYTDREGVRHITRCNNNLRSYNFNLEVKKKHDE